ncbi:MULTISPECIES: hypothetical protein [Cupriavidus]
MESNHKRWPWRPSYTTVALVVALALFCVYSVSESKRKEAELRAAIKVRCSNEKAAVSEVCRRASAAASKASPE